MTQEEKIARMSEIEKDLTFLKAAIVDINNESKLIVERMTYLEKEAENINKKVQDGVKEYRKLSKELGIE